MTEPILSCPPPESHAAMRSPAARQFLSALFTSLSRDSCRWSLTRTLQSDNPMDIKGELRGTATFTPLRSTTGSTRDMVYREEGEMPNTIGMGMAGLRWTKKYIWRMSENGNISVWFVKVGGLGSSKKSPDEEEKEEEADYLFHDFEFDASDANDTADTTTAAVRDQPADFEATQLVTPPIPPFSTSIKALGQDTTVLTAHGNHLCINDMYRTAYAFRIRSDTGEVLSWASRHVVKGPKKNQDIVNLYELDG